MADNYGVWTGVGAGLNQFGQALAYRGQKLDADREKQADKFETDARNIAANIAQIGGAQSPEAQPLVQQLYRTVQMHNALYPPHETPALIARIGKFLGKQPGAPREDPRAAMTPESIMASTAVSPTGTKNLLTDMGEYIQAYRLAYPNSTLEQARQSFVQNKMERAARDTPRWVDYISKDGKTPRKVNQNDPEDVARADAEGFVPYVAGVFKAQQGGPSAKPGTLAFALQLRYPGRDLTTLTQEEYDAGVEAFNEAKDTSVAGRAARYLVRTGQASDLPTAYDMYAKQQYDAQVARAEAAQGQVQKMDPAKMQAFALANLRRGDNVNPFGRAQGALRTQYAMATADIMAGGAGLVMAEQATAAGLTGSINNLIGQRGTREAAEGRLVKALDLMEQNSNKVGRFGGTIWNDLLVIPQGDIREYPELAALRNAVETAVNDYAIAVGSSGATGGRTTDNATNHAREVLNLGMSKGTMSAVAANMKQEAVNAIAGTNEAIRNAQDALRDLGNQPAPGQVVAPSANDPLGIK